MSKVNELKDVPNSEVKKKVAQFEALGYEVEKVRQPDGKWTLIVTKPD